jgi:glucose/arabinose dehydrogenase
MCLRVVPWATKLSERSTAVCNGVEARGRREFRAGLLFVVLGICLALAPSASAVTLPPNFREDVVLSGLTQPLAVAFSPDGRVFVAEKSGIIKVYTSLSDTSPDVVADLRTQVHDFWDRGLLGMALHPNFPGTNAIYVLYTYDAPPAVAAHEHRWCAVRRLRAGTDPRLVPAVPKPLDR